MIILLSKNDEYIKEMNGIVFSDDIKERIMGRISRQKRKDRKTYISIAAVITVFLCIIAAVSINSTRQENGYLSEYPDTEYAKKQDSESGVIDVWVDLDSDIDDIVLNPKQMVIINIQNIKDNTDSLSLNGRLTGDDREYSFGYIIDQNYTQVLSDCTEEFISDEVDIKGGTEIGLYLINCSDKALTFSGNVCANYNDLVYRDYGSEALEIPANSTIIINLSKWSGSCDIEGVYMYNCSTKQTIKWEFADTIEYESEQGGVYLIYALTADGDIIELLDGISVEVHIGNDGIFIGL
jgi:biopolymer transport protein ExbD